jgi:DNA-binding CsgD family transcriptional regulator
LASERVYAKGWSGRTGLQTSLTILTLESGAQVATNGGFDFWFIGETAIWLDANIRFNRAVRERAREMAATLGPYEAYREARRLRLASEDEAARLFAYNVELAAAEIAGLSPDRPYAKPLGPEPPIWFLPFLNARQASALRAGVEWLLARLVGAPAPEAPAVSKTPDERPAAPAEAATAQPVEAETEDAEPAAPRADLTARQIECLRWTAEGKSSWDIAQILGISPRTVDEHLDNACRKLGVKRRAQAAVAAARAGLL